MRTFITRHIYKFKNIYPYLLACLISLWPATVMASHVNTVLLVALSDLGLGVPFTVSWITIWFFALCGGLMANFMKLDLDEKFHFVYLAKPFIGTILGVAVIMQLTKRLAQPDPAYALTALGVALIGAPLTQGALIYISTSNVLTRFFDYLAGKFMGGK